MWCTICREDVPGILSPAEQQYRCARCGEAMVLSAPVEAPPERPTIEPAVPRHMEPLAGVASLAPPPDDFWETESQLRHVRRLLDSLKRSQSLGSGPTPTVAEPEPKLGGKHYRIDDAHPTLKHDGAPRPTTERERASVAPAESLPRKRSRDGARRLRFDEAEQRPEPAREQRTRRPLVAMLSWLTLAAGLGVSTCGGVLTAWGTMEARPELREYGLPILLAGQVVLLLGLVLQLDVLAYRNRQAERQLDAVDDTLSTIKERLGRRAR